MSRTRRSRRSRVAEERYAAAGLQAAPARLGGRPLQRSGSLLTVTLLSAAMVSGGTKTASASADPHAQQAGCTCVASAADSRGAASDRAHSQQPAVRGNGNGQGQDRRGPQDQHEPQGKAYGQQTTPVAPVQEPPGPSVRRRHGDRNGGAQHGSGLAHGHQGNGPTASPSHTAGSSRAQRMGPGPPPWAAASGRASLSRRVTTPTAAAPAVMGPAPTPPATASSAATGQPARAPRMARRHSGSSHGARRHVRTKSPRHGSRRVARVGARARGARSARARAARASASPARGSGSGSGGDGQPKTRPGSGAAHGSSVLSAPQALSRTIERLVRVIPTAIWLALLAAVTLAAAAAAAAVLASRRGRRHARAIVAAERTAATDPLTGVLNRRGFGGAVERELARARRHGHPFALAYLDVRGLKSVNDSDGHLVGDELIKQVAGLLRDCARAGDVVGRLGGDEFALLLAEQSANGAARVADRLREHVPARRAAVGTDVRWDLTVGTASYPEDGTSFQTLLSVADRRLYAQRGIQLNPIEKTSELTAAPTGA